MPISLKANSDGSAEILNGVVSALKINTDGSLEGTTIDGKLNRSENINLGVSVPASGTAVDFVGIPEGVKRVAVIFDGVSTNGTSPIIVQLGVGLGVEAVGYKGSVNGGGATTPASVLHSTGFAVNANPIAATVQNGVMFLSGCGSDTWAMMSVVGQSDLNRVGWGGGAKTLSGPLDSIRITTVNGTDQFDAGVINISWEF